MYSFLVKSRRSWGPSERKAAGELYVVRFTGIELPPAPALWDAFGRMAEGMTIKKIYNFYVL
jgi:hypothetical protein